MKQNCTELPKKRKAATRLKKTKATFKTIVAPKSKTHIKEVKVSTTFCWGFVGDKKPLGSRFLFPLSSQQKIRQLFLLCVQISKKTETEATEPV